jgi:hypothetical protein
MIKTIIKMVVMADSLVYGSLYMGVALEFIISAALPSGNTSKSTWLLRFPFADGLGKWRPARGRGLGGGGGGRIIVDCRNRPIYLKGKHS